MKTRLFFYMVMLIFISSSCTKESRWDSYNPGKGGHHGHNYGLKIAVVSDIHYTDASLLANNAAAGTAFQNYAARDPKLLEYSEPIFKNIMSQLRSQDPDILLIPGDLTKDGEKIDHEKMACLLKQLSDAHIKVYVVPGNHDINNPEATRYNGNNAYPTPTVSAAEFSSIYAQFGFENAISRDENSLSYISQPFPDVKLWVLAIDDCKYYDNKGSAITSGVIKPATKQWALAWMEKAKQRHIQVIGLMHHGIQLHYSVQNMVDPGYVTDNYETDASDFLAAGVNIWFTGHYHANDITKMKVGDKELFDIETGSPVMVPSPYRMVTLTSKGMDISTRYVTSIGTPMPGGASFPAYTHQWMADHLDGYMRGALSSPPYEVPEPLLSYTVPLFRNAFMAHFGGDESITADEQAYVNGLLQYSTDLYGIVTSVWTDFAPTDNQLHIDLPAK